jgi:hypothetical protein
MIEPAYALQPANYNLIRVLASRHAICAFRLPVFGRIKSPFRAAIKHLDGGWRRDFRCAKGCNCRLRSARIGVLAAFNKGDFRPN